MRTDHHFYLVDPDSGEIEPAHKLSLQGARKSGAYASVTTKLKLIYNPYLENWRGKTLCELSVNNPKLPDETIDEYYARLDNMTWGQPVRWDGVMFQSDEFARHIHAEIDRWNHNKEVFFSPEWAQYCYGWQTWYEANIIQTIASEKMLACNEMRVAGVADFIGEHREYGVVLCDYKCRDCKGKNKGKFYDKDLLQLAIEAKMWATKTRMDKVPRIFSICIDTDTGRLYERLWTEELQDMGERHFRAINACYNILNDM